MLLGREGVLAIARWGDADKLAGMDIVLANLELEGLTSHGTSDQLSSGFEARADFGEREFCEAINITGDDDLQGTLATTIVEFNEEKCLTSGSCGSSPTGHCDDMVDVRFVVLVQRGNSDSVSICKEGNWLRLNSWVADKGVLYGAKISSVFSLGFISSSCSSCGSLWLCCRRQARLLVRTRRSKFREIASEPHFCLIVLTLLFHHFLL